MWPRNDVSSSGTALPCDERQIPHCAMLMLLRPQMRGLRLGNIHRSTGLWRGEVALLQGIHLGGARTKWPDTATLWCMLGTGHTDSKILKHCRGIYISYLNNYYLIINMIVLQSSPLIVLQSTFECHFFSHVMLQRFIDFEFYFHFTEMLKREKTKMENSDSPWRPLKKGKAERKRRRNWNGRRPWRLFALDPQRQNATQFYATRRRQTASKCLQVF